ncbi:DUF421 domain-containing protein [Flavobacterium sp. N2270]|jgi:uncharacterized membrane protein YcaP (DUF421 family)|uniref:DUF421 domain-containing protein n=1 Tax=Flavobacterium sp. N2270 TaxID=2986831 RepID=UPI0022248DC8|nr:YetF domain-containing protein [Flavobacterium sp. N2270]
MENYLDIIFRSISVYLFLVIVLRFFGKKELSQLNTSDVILVLLLSNSVQNAMVGNNSSLLGGLLAATSLFLINFIFKKIVVKSAFFKQLISDKPEILIHNGVIEFKTLARLGITSEELQESMREHGIQFYKDVKLAIFEIDGNISFISGENSNLKRSVHKRKIRKNLGNLN